APPAELIDRLRVALGPPRDEGLLLAAIWANPDDDGPRAVYADWLTERGDPRGEFITLQLAGEEKKAKKLLKGNELAWAGPIAGAIAKKGLVYERGFVARANTAFKQPKVAEELGDHPAWATLVEILGVHSAWEYGKSHHTNTISPAFRSLRIVRGFGWGGVEKLAEGGPWAIEHLEVHADMPETTDALKQLDTLPALRTLVLSGIHHGVGWLWGCPIMATVEHLSVDRLEPGIVAQAESRSSIRTLTLRYGRPQGTVTFHRGPDGRFGAPAVDGPDRERVLEVLSGERAPQGHAGRPFGMDLSPDGRTLAVAWGYEVRFLDAATLEELRVLDDVLLYHRVSFSPDGTQVAAWGQDSRVVLVDVATAKVLARHRSRMGIDDVTWLPDGRLASVRPLTVAGEERKPSGWCLCALPDGWIALGDQDRVVFAPADGKAKRAPLEVGKGVVHALAWRDGRLAVGRGSTVVAMDGEDVAWEAHLEQRVGSIRALPDGRWLVRCSDTFLLDDEGAVVRKIASRDGGTYISSVVVRGEQVIVAREDGIRRL
ncbi:MAG: TIGR02996 domain-containing protein, partial [Myxococcales bacterium]|nr:TIGR02996 domain-containing protein [Myxococcales bacterium]